MEKEKLENELKNMLRLFYQSLQDYEHESGTRICEDERDSKEMVQIFIESEDAFNYENLIKRCSIPIDITPTDLDSKYEHLRFEWNRCNISNQSELLICGNCKNKMDEDEGRWGLCHNCAVKAEL